MNAKNAKNFKLDMIGAFIGQLILCVSYQCERKSVPYYAIFGLSFVSLLGFFTQVSVIAWKSEVSETILAKIRSTSTLDEFISISPFIKLRFG